MNQSAVAYFHQLRMKKAKRLLYKKGAQIKQVAFTLGYNHINDFSRAYKSYYGYSPSRDQLK